MELTRRAMISDVNPSYAVANANKFPLFSVCKMCVSLTIMLLKRSSTYYHVTFRYRSLQMISECPAMSITCQGPGPQTPSNSVLPASHFGKQLRIHAAPLELLAEYLARAVPRTW